MKLKKLIKDIPDIQVKGPRDITITGICANSKLVAPGNLFIAKRGRTSDGAAFIPEAMEAGANAVLTDMANPSLKGITQVIYPEISKLEGLLAARYYEFPSDQLLMIGITGTNGKTTTSYLVKHLLGSCGMIGTIEYHIGEQTIKATHTTPDVVANHKMLREMVQQNCHSCVMEVTSHGLDQRRVDNVHFDIAVFTNLTPEHLDYHVTMDHYCAAKNKLFLSLKDEPKDKRCCSVPATAIVNVDSPWHEKVLRGCQAKVVTFGMNSKADITADDVRVESEGTYFNLVVNRKKTACFLSLVGRYNLYNGLAAIAVCLTAGMSAQAIAEKLKSFTAVPGRLAKVPNRLGLHIYVDFSHKEDALRTVLKCLHETKKGRLFTVFGCGGNRDRLKRPKMAEASEEYSDFTYVTNDNPRNEDPAAIAGEIVVGFKKADSFLVELDRRAAIQKAIEGASEGDIILIAGRGHETHQIFAHKTIEFSDGEVAASLCETLAEAAVL